MCNRLEIVESIPEGLSYSGPVSRSIYSGWSKLIEGSAFTIDFAAFYWSLLGSDVGPNYTTLAADVRLPSLPVPSTYSTHFHRHFAHSLRVTLLSFIFCYTLC